MRTAIAILLGLVLVLQGRCADDSKPQETAIVGTVIVVRARANHDDEWTEETVPAVQLELNAADTHLTTITNTAGEFRFEGLKKGFCAIRATKAGFKKTMVQGIYVLVGNQTRMRIPLWHGSPDETVKLSAND